MPRASAKTPRGIFRRRRGLCRGPFIGHSAKPLPRARTALGKEKNPSRAGAVGGFFAEGRPSAKKLFFFEFFLPRPALGKDFFLIFAEGLLPSPRQRNFQDFSQKKLCRGLLQGPSANVFFLKLFTKGRPSAKK